MECADIGRTLLCLKEHNAHRLSLTDGEELAPHIFVKTLPDVYPIGDEIATIYQATGRLVRPGNLPITKGVIVLNVETLYNVSRAVRDDLPVTEKWLTIAGDVEKTMVLRVPIGMRVRELLALSAKLRGQNCDEEARRLCEALELDPARKIGALSLGNRKKVGIVCALQHRPQLYILDEPTSGLDPLMQKTFYELLRERNAEGATVFLSSHILSEVGRYCKHASVIREGRVLTSDSVQALRHTGVKRVAVRGAFDCATLDGVADVRTEDETLTFLYSGDVHRLLAQLSDAAVTDVNITDPSLDEVFMHYYTKEETV
jgi:ABC-type Na+ transport system ATPase subunit NatA